MRTGARAMIASATATLVLSFAADRLGLPLTGTLVGAFSAMLSTAIVTDTSPRDQRVTSLLLIFPTAAGLVTGTLAAPHDLVSLAVFCVVIFVAVLVRRFGPRGTALGMLGFNTFFISLFFQARTADLPWMLSAAAAGAAIAYAVRYWLVPDHPSRQLPRALLAFRIWVAAVLVRASRAILGPWQGAPVLRLRRALDRLNETALLVEDLMCDLGLGRGAGERAFDLELAIGRVVAGASAIAMSNGVPEESRRLLSQALVHAARAVRGDSDARKAMEDALRRASDPVGVEKAAASRVERFSAALRDLLRVALDGSRREGQSAPAPEQGNGAANAAPQPAKGLHPMTRQAVQATVAGALAMGIGARISPERWFWAVLTAFIVLTRATTASEILARAWSRTAGTVIGVLLGMGLAALVHGHPRAEWVLLFACVFLAFHSLRASYAVMVLWITCALALLYSLLGRYSTALLYVRVEETLVGAAIGTVVAATVLPSQTAAKVRDALTALLRATGDYLDTVSAEGSAGHGAALIAGARTLDRLLRDLRAAAEPVTRRLIAPERETARLLTISTSLVFCLRQLAHADFACCIGADASLFLHRTAARLAGAVRALGEAVSERGRPAVAEIAPNAHAGNGANGSRAALPPGQAQDTTLPFYWLDRVETLAQEMAGALGLPPARRAVRRLRAPAPSSPGDPPGGGRGASGTGAPPR